MKKLLALLFVSVIQGIIIATFLNVIGVEYPSGLWWFLCVSLNILLSTTIPLFDWLNNVK